MPGAGRRQPGASNLFGAAVLLVLLAWPGLTPAAAQALAASRGVVAGDHRPAGHDVHSLAPRRVAAHQVLTPTPSLTAAGPLQVRLSRLRPVAVPRAEAPRAHRVAAPPVRAPPAADR